MSLQEIFSTVLNMSLTGSVVICFVLTARLLLRKAPKVFSYALWSVVLFRLLCPVSISSALSLLNFTKATVRESEGIVTAVAYAPVLDIYQYNERFAHTEVQESDLFNRHTEAENHTSIPVNRTEVTPTPDAVRQQATAEPAREPIYYAVIIWLVGIGVLLIYNINAYCQLGKKIAGAVRLRNQIYLADHIPSAFVMGVIHPRIYLPSVLEASERKYILAHEYYHIRRKDHIIRLLAYSALCMHWFNPLVWFAFALSGKDMEMSCDEAVIKRLGPEIRADYSASLLRLATGHRIIALTPLAFGEGDTKGRVLNMAKWKKPKVWVMFLAAIICISVLVACAMNPTEENQQAENNDATSPSETAAAAWISEADPEEVCRQAIEQLKNCESYLIRYSYDANSVEEAGTIEYRRHGNDLLIADRDEAYLGSSIYFNGMYGMNYGDYWVMETEKSELDPNSWLTHWSMKDKQISDTKLVNGSTIVFEAVWPLQADPSEEYQSTLAYSFDGDGNLETIRREYVRMTDGEVSSETVDQITIVEEAPEDTYAAIKTIADQCITEAELETYRSQSETVTDVPSNKTTYDKDYALGAGQMGWKFLNDSWRFKLGAENVTPTSVELVHCESDNHHASLTAEEGFWLEVLTDGKWQYVDEAKKSVEAQKESISVSWSTKDRYRA